MSFFEWNNNETEKELTAVMQTYELEACKCNW